MSNVSGGFSFNSISGTMAKAMEKSDQGIADAINLVNKDPSNVAYQQQLAVAEHTWELIADMQTEMIKNINETVKAAIQGS